MRNVVRQGFIAFVAVALAYIIIGGMLSSFTSGRHKDPIFDQENSAWRASSNNPVDRGICYWFGLCGGFHFLSGYTAEQIDALPIVDFANQWTLGPDYSESWSEKERKLREIPQYVLDYAPYVHLFSKEQYWPSDVAEHLAHTSQRINYTEIVGNARGLVDLDKLNDEDHIGVGHNIYLQSIDDVEGNPDWLSGRRNIPNGLQTNINVESVSQSTRATARPPHWDLRRRQIESPPNPNAQNLDAFGRSNAPAYLVVVPKEDGVVDAFWFFFYSFNKAPKVLNIQFGNHIGDWEHTVVRFRNGVPESVACSEHFFGSAYSYDALEKYLVNDTGDVLGTWSNRTVLEEAKRPVVYSAGGSHAMYARPGLHPYILPFSVLRDETDRGPLWDPTLNLHAYTYDLKTLRAATRNPRSPTGWFEFNGRWGDKYYKLSDPRQYRFAGQYHYLNGPYGPKFKRLWREKVCQSLERCVIKDEIERR